MLLNKADFRSIAIMDDSAIENILDNYWQGSIPVNINRIAERLNINLLYESLDRNIVSLIKENKDNVLLIINKRLTINEKRFITAHNIAHKLYHINEYRKEIIDGKAILKSDIVNNKMEVEANEFARKILLPADDFTKDYNQVRKSGLTDIMSTTYLSMRYKVSSSLVEDRINDIANTGQDK